MSIMLSAISTPLAQFAQGHSLLLRYTLPARVWVFHQRTSKSEDIVGGMPPSIFFYYSIKCKVKLRRVNVSVLDSIFIFPRDSGYKQYKI